MGLHHTAWPQFFFEARREEEICFLVVFWFLFWFLFVVFCFFWCFVCSVLFFFCVFFCVGLFLEKNAAYMSCLLFVCFFHA